MGKKRGGLFDFNHDGKESIGEMYVGYQMYKNWLKRKEEKNSTADYSFGDPVDDSWRDYCEDGSEYDIDPDDYETEGEYEEAIQEAKDSWRDYCEDGSEYDIDPDDYETEEEYEEAIQEAKDSWHDYCQDGSEYGIDLNDFETEEDYDEAREELEAGTITLSFSICNEEYEQKKKERAEFLENGKEQFVPARYLTLEGDYLYAQAIKDYFAVPCTLPNETEEREIEFVQILKKIARTDIELSLQVWDWCLKNFLPFALYDDYCEKNLCKDVILELYDFPDGFTEQLVCYLRDNRGFLSEFIRAGDEPIYGMNVLITSAIRGNALLVADVLFRSELKKAEEDWKEINKLAEDVIRECKNYEEVETIEYFQDNYLPLFAEIPDGMVQDEIPVWEKEIAEYIDHMEETCDKYAYSRRYAWRAIVPDGSLYGLNPLFYQTEEEYLQAWNKRKSNWEKRNKKEETLVADPEQYETDENIFFYCSVRLPFSRRPYSFLTEDTTIEIGDTVVVPVGQVNDEIKGRVIAVGKCMREAAPYPIEKMKKIIRKSDKASGVNGKT